MITVHAVAVHTFTVWRTNIIPYNTISFAGKSWFEDISVGAYAKLDDKKASGGTSARGVCRGMSGIRRTMNGQFTIKNKVYITSIVFKNIVIRFLRKNQWILNVYFLNFEMVRFYSRNLLPAAPEFSDWTLWNMNNFISMEYFSCSIVNNLKIFQN